MSSDHDSPNPYESPEAAPVDVAAQESAIVLDFARRKRRQLVLLLVAMAISGFLAGFISENSGWSTLADLVSGLAVAILILGWCDIDREERQLSRWPFFVALMILCPGPLIIVPTYLFVTRGVGGFAATAKAAAFLLLMIGVMIATSVMALLLTGAEL